MEEHKLILVDLVNKLLKWVLSLTGIGFDPHKDIIPSHIVMALLVTAIIIFFFKSAVKNLSIFPGKMQNALEMLYKFFQGLVDDIIGHEGRKFIPALGTLGIFIAVANLIGLFPEMGSPTSNLNVTAGCALFIFIYYHTQGVKKHGLWGYFKTFTGPNWGLAWLFLPIELVSHISRLLSLSMRLFGNIFGEDMVIVIISTYLLSFFIPLPVMALAIFTSLLQAFIFVMLSTIYLAGAVSEEH
ncbi:MAG: F0F1 ATP synthase subunit A [Acidobacteria bacterium]|jgi:F-type H+-transporting ATPase subunit a|nr:F0F1 ATP synthase subunit A [Acidobacteriota bacterium]